MCKKSSINLCSKLPLGEHRGGLTLNAWDTLRAPWYKINIPFSYFALSVFIPAIPCVPFYFLPNIHLVLNPLSKIAQKSIYLSLSLFIYLFFNCVRSKKRRCKLILAIPLMAVLFQNSLDVSCSTWNKL